MRHLTDSGEWNEGVKEKRVSALAAQLGLRAIERRESGEKSLSRREAGTQAKRLMWITVGQTSEEDKTANMSHCSLLAFNNRCLVSPSPVMLPNRGWFDPMNVLYKYTMLPADRDDESERKVRSVGLSTSVCSWVLSHASFIPAACTLSPCGAASGGLYGSTGFRVLKNITPISQQASPLLSD